MTPKPEPAPEPRTSSLEAFRTKKAKRPSLHALEKAALVVITTHAVALPWMLGTMWPWAQWISLALASLGFVIALLPRHYTEENTGGGEFLLMTWPKLIRFPIFWIGLALLAYITLQALNPAWKYIINPQGQWQMQKIEAKAWLPSGVIAPFGRWNQWRMLVIYGSGFLTVCSLWVAFTRRRTLQFFLIALAVNGLLVALLGAAQRMTKAGKIYWAFESVNPQFFSSFVYKNHGAAYLFLALTMICGLASWFYLRGVRRFEKSNPSGVFAFFAACVAVAITVSLARGVTLIMLVFLLCCIAAFVIHQFLLPRGSRKPAIAIGLALVLVFGCFLMTGLESLGSDQAWDRMKQGIMRQDNSLASREDVKRAALDMLKDFGPRGAGAGSFRFLFTIYQYRYPQLVMDPLKNKLYWEHAHNDILEFPIELGIVGTGRLLLGFGYWGITLVRAYFWENPLSVCLVSGTLLTLVYAWWDFPFQCPAVLLTWCILWTAATMWARFEERGAK